MEAMKDKGKYVNSLVYLHRYDICFLPLCLRIHNI